ncbi:MAG: cytochrome P450 [Protaetiibacter sp.]
MTASEAPHAAHPSGACPVTGARRLPSDGVPLRPSPTLAAWRREGAITPLTFADGHDGWIATRFGSAHDLLANPAFSRTPTDRLPLEGHGTIELDDRALESLRVASILDQDGEQHARLRRALTARFSVKAARALRPFVEELVARTLDEFLAREDSPADLNEHYAQPISAAVHARVLGIPDSHRAAFIELVLTPTTPQQKFDLLREVIRLRREEPGDDLLSDLVRSELSPSEIEGLAFVVTTSGRDSVAYMIATTTVALLTHPEQLARLRAQPELVETAVEEFLRVGAMFLTLFPRTATEDVEVEGTTMHRGETVVVSPVAVNRDPERFAEPDAFDITRDAFGHLGFGFGIHGCVGQQVARVEIREAIGQLIRRAPALRLVEADQTSPMPFANQVGTYEAGRVLVDWH